MRQAEWTSATGRTSRPATGPPWRRYWPMTSHSDDRRRVVNAGIRRGRDAEIANMQAVAELGVDKMTSTVIATRGDRLALSRTASRRGNRADGFRTELLSVVEINADNRFAAASRSISTTSTPPSPSSTPGTSPAKRPPTRTRGLSSRGIRRVQPARTPRRRRTGSPSTTGHA